MRLTHGDSGASFSAPDGWAEVLGDDGTVIALEPDEDAAGFRASLVLTVAPNGLLTFGQWQAGTEALLGDTVHDYLLLDREKLEVAGRPGGRRLAHHVSTGGAALVMQQWFTAEAGVGYTLTATVDAPRFAAAGTLFAASAASLRLGGAR